MFFNFITYDINIDTVFLYSFILFYLGASGIFMNKRNVIYVLLFLELILLAVNFNFLSFSVILDILIGQVIGFFILTAAGSEVSIGLAFVLLLFRIRGLLNLNFFLGLKG